MSMTHSNQAKGDLLLGERLVALMFRHRINKGHLAEALHIDRSGLSRRLHGTSSWTLVEVVRLAEILGTSVAYLIGETADDRILNAKTAEVSSTVSSVLVAGAGYDPATSRL